MQLITGGKGFIGMHVARARLDLGESCLLTTRNTEMPLPDFLQKELGRKVFVEALDVTDRQMFRDVAKRHGITGIIQLAGAVIGRGSVSDTLAEAQSTITGYLNALQVAEECKVARVSVASTIGVYAGIKDLPGREDHPLPLSPTHPLPVSKKILELMGALLSGKADYPILNLRIGGAWGPLNHHPLSPWNLTGHLIRAAVDGARWDASVVWGDEGIDLCYVKDCGRAIALLQTSPTLRHSTYNVSTGPVMTNKDLVGALRRQLPGTSIDVREGFDPAGPGTTFSMDTTRLQSDTGFKPQYDLEAAVADYAAWLGAGNRY